MDRLGKVIVFDDKGSLVAHAIALWKKICAESIADRGYMAAALSGGRTPVDLYRALAEEVKGLPWEMIHFFLVDERFVPRNDRDSNYGMILKTLLEVSPIPEENIHPIDTGASGPDEAARKYEEEMIRFFRLSPGSLPRFDLIMLGLGEDGHIASLFPESPALHELNRLSMAATPGGTLHNRITLTMSVINNGRHIVFMIEGIHKAAVLRKVVQEADPLLPASQIEPVAGDLLFLADRDAAGLLSNDFYQAGGL